MWKWIGGILATSIGGAALFFLAGPHGLLNPSPEMRQQAYTKIQEFNIQPTYTSDDWQSYVDAAFFVVNEGDKAAVQCQIEWFSHGDMFAGTASNIFGLMPSEQRTIKLRFTRTPQAECAHTNLGPGWTTPTTPLRALSETFTSQQTAPTGTSGDCCRQKILAPTGSLMVQMTSLSQDTTATATPPSLRL